MASSTDLLPLLRGQRPTSTNLPALADHGLLAFAARVDASPELQSRAAVQAAWTRLHLDVAHDIAARLRTARIPAVFIKGVALASTVYDPPELRTFGDIDLLVARADFDRAATVLDAARFRRDPGATNPMERDFFREESPGVSVCVDLHWDLTGDEGLQAPMRMDVAAILSRARDADGLPVPAPEDSLLIAASNLVRSCVDRLILIVDFAKLSAQPVNWNEVTSRAEAWGLKTSLWMGLVLAGDHAGATVPASTMAALAPAAWKQSWMRALLTPEKLCRTGKDRDVRYRHLLKALCLDSAADVLKMIAALPKGIVKKLGAGGTRGPAGA